MFAWLRRPWRRDLAIAGAAVLLVVAVRVIVHVHEDFQRGPRTRPFSIGVISVDGRPVVAGAPVKAEAAWSPPYDADVIGWALYAKTPGSIVTLLSADNTVLARAVGGSDEITPRFVPAGTSYRLPRQQQLTLRVDLLNPVGVEYVGRTLAMIYFVPVRGGP